MKKMQPVSRSDMECYQKFRYHELLKERLRVEEEEEEEELHLFSNPAFRLEVKRGDGDDVGGVDAACNLNSPRAEGNLLRVHKTSNHYMMRYSTIISSAITCAMCI